MFHLILGLLQKTSFWANSNSSCNILLSYLVKNSIQRNMNRRGEKRVGARRQAQEIAFIYQNNNNIGKQCTFGKLMEKVSYVWKIKLSRPWTLGHDSCSWQCHFNTPIWRHFLRAHFNLHCCWKHDIHFSNSTGVVPLHVPHHNPSCRNIKSM